MLSWFEYSKFIHATDQYMRTMKVLFMMLKA